MSIEIIAQKVRSGARLDRLEAEELFHHGSDELLQNLATDVRRRYHPDMTATYLIMAIVNYTNVCVAKCDYCAFYKLPHEAGTYLLNFDQLVEKIDSLQQSGGTLVGFNGGFHPKLRLQDYANLFRSLREHYGDGLEFYEMTVAEFMFSCKLSKLDYAAGAELLKASGTKWITGGGAEILDDGFRMRHSPGKYKVEDYYAAQKAILAAGLGSTATMVIGFDETSEERFNHLERLRQFQDQCGQEAAHQKLTSFLCWTYKPFNNELGGEEISLKEYLRWLAISRIYLDNFEHIRTSVLTKNEGALEGLHWGANDFDLPTEDEVTQKAGATISTEFQAILDHGRSMGFDLQHRKPFPVPSSDTQQHPSQSFIQGERPEALL